MFVETSWRERERERGREKGRERERESTQLYFNPAVVNLQIINYFSSQYNLSSHLIPGSNGHWPYLKCPQRKNCNRMGGQKLASP